MSNLFNLILLCSPLENNLRTLISYCRPYFAPNATAEMLEEWRPLMCPFDVTMAKAMSYCEMFLPTFDGYRRKEQTFQLWFDELMAFWEACPNQPLFEPHLFGLFARMADHTRGEFPFFSAVQKEKIFSTLPLVYYRRCILGPPPSILPDSF